LVRIVRQLLVDHGEHVPWTAVHINLGVAEAPSNFVDPPTRMFLPAQLQLTMTSTDASRGSHARPPKASAQHTRNAHLPGPARSPRLLSVLTGRRPTWTGTRHPIVCRRPCRGESSPVATCSSRTQQVLSITRHWFIVFSRNVPNLGCPSRMAPNRLQRLCHGGQARTCKHQTSRYV
jgi:hypothetical protein